MKIDWLCEAAPRWRNLITGEERCESPPLGELDWIEIR